MEDDVRLRAIDWEPIGTGSKARLIVVDAEGGDVHDIETLDLGRWIDRTKYARRLVEDGLVPWDHAAVDLELLRIAVERCNAKPEAEAALPTLADAFGDWAQNESTPCVTTGFQPLDSLAAGDLPGGLPEGTITILMGPPGTGKSALALQATVGALLGDSSLRAVWCRGEMSAEHLAARAVAVGSVLLGDPKPVVMSQARRRRPAARAVAESLRAGIGDRLTIVPPTLTVEKIERAVVTTGARLCVIDYLQLVRQPQAVDARTEVDGVMNGLRAMSLEHRCAIVLISNIAKSIDGNSRIGTLGKGSGQIDYDADIVLLGQIDEEPDAAGTVAVSWRCKKHRHGQARDLRTRFDPALQTFTDAEAVAPYDDFADYDPKRAAR